MRLYTASGKHLINNIYGVGIGYPQRRSDGMMLKSSDSHLKFYKYPKVDSFDLYKGHLGDVFLRKVLDLKNRDSSQYLRVNQIKNA